MKLQHAGAIVTGGARGIGAATVVALQEAGARVASLDRLDSPAADVSLRCDIARESEVVDAVAAAAADLGALDIAVVNAATGGSARFLDLTTDEWDRLMNVNLRGAFVTMRECARAMVEQAPRDREGSIIAVTSVSGFLTERLMAHYSVSKAGLAALVRVAARELGPAGIRVNAVAPGTTDTPMFEATDRLPGYRDRVARRAALGRLGTPEDVARVIVALCTLDWVTGQVLAADGGLALASPLDPADHLPGERP